MQQQLLIAGFHFRESFTPNILRHQKIPSEQIKIHRGEALRFLRCLFVVRGVNSLKRSARAEKKLGRIMDWWLGKG